MTSSACLVSSGLKSIFHWKSQLWIHNGKSFLNRCKDHLQKYGWIMENKDVPSGNDLVLVESPSERLDLE